MQERDKMLLLSYRERILELSSDDIIMHFYKNQNFRCDTLYIFSNLIKEYADLILSDKNLHLVAQIEKLIALYPFSKNVYDSVKIKLDSSELCDVNIVTSIYEATASQIRSIIPYVEIMKIELKTLESELSNIEEIINNSNIHKLEEEIVSSNNQILSLTREKEELNAIKCNKLEDTIKSLQDKEIILISNKKKIKEIEDRIKKYNNFDTKEINRKLSEQLNIIIDDSIKSVF